MKSFGLSCEGPKKMGTINYLYRQQVGTHHWHIVCRNGG